MSTFSFIESGTLGTLYAACSCDLMKLLALTAKSSESSQLHNGTKHIVSSNNLREHIMQA